MKNKRSSPPLSFSLVPSIIPALQLEEPCEVGSDKPGGGGDPVLSLMCDIPENPDQSSIILSILSLPDPVTYSVPFFLLDEHLETP